MGDLFLDIKAQAVSRWSARYQAEILTLTSYVGSGELWNGKRTLDSSSQSYIQIDQLSSRSRTRGTMKQIFRPI